MIIHYPVDTRKPHCSSPFVTIATGWPIKLIGIMKQPELEPDPSWPVRFTSLFVSHGGLGDTRWSTLKNLGAELATFDLDVRKQLGYVPGATANDDSVKLRKHSVVIVLEMSFIHHGFHAKFFWNVFELLDYLEKMPNINEHVNYKLKSV